MPVNTDTPYVEKVATAHVEEKLGHGAADEAKNASDNEHKAAFWETFKKYRAGVFWSCIISMTIVMEGYDTILMYNFWAYPTCEYCWLHSWVQH
jgi:SP family general alpha glucoside:H+ symporter-like MFS transporter